MSYDPETILSALFSIAETAGSPEHAGDAMQHLARAVEAVHAHEDDAAAPEEDDDR